MKTMYVCVCVCESEQAALTSRARSCEGGTPRGELPDLERANHRTAGDCPGTGALSPHPPPGSARSSPGKGSRNSSPVTLQPLAPPLLLGPNASCLVKEVAALAEGNRGAPYGLLLALSAPDRRKHLAMPAHPRPGLSSPHLPV